MAPRDRPTLLMHKAKQDELALEKLLGEPDIDDDLLGFHAQQAAEKILKAVLASRSVDYPKTHNLRTLVEVLTAHGCVLPEDLADIDRLTPFGTTFRYDEILPDVGSDRLQWLGWVRRLRAVAETLLSRTGD